MSKNPTSRKNNLVIQELDKEVLIYDLNKNKAFCLNETSSLIWHLCDGENSIEEIAKNVSRKLNSPADEEFVWLALNQLKEENLLENDEGITSTFNGVSRREVIRKVGLGTMLALPLISSLLAPVPAMAQSRCTPAVAAAGNCVCSPAPGGGLSGTPCVPTTNNCGPCRTVYNANANGTTACICAP